MTKLGEIGRRRLLAQRIAGRRFARPQDAVAGLGAVQAQDYLGALWAVGLRLTRGSEAAVERAIEERRIVRTWPMRGTLHFVAADDARWMTELLAPRAAAAATGRLRGLGIDEAALSRARRALVKRLEGGRRLTRPEAYRVLERAGVRVASGLHVLWRLAHDGLLCFGPRRGKQQTFVLFEEWLPRAKRLAREEALATLAQRYFAGHGPATVEDLAWWSGLTLGDARLAIRLAGDCLVEESGYWLDPATAAVTRSPAAPRERAHVLPAFDELLVGYRDRSAAFERGDASRVVAGGIFRPAVVLDGRVAGVWRRAIDRGTLRCAVTPFAALGTAERRAVEQAFDRYARFLALPRRDGIGMA